MAKRDWAVGPIEPNARWAKRADPQADLDAIVAAGIALSGHAPEGVDRANVDLGIFRIVRYHATFMSNGMGLRGVDRDIDAIFHRADFCWQMLWDYFPHREAEGVAIHDRLMLELGREDIPEVIAAGITGGGGD